MCEEKQVWKDQKTHQMEERRVCCSGERVRKQNESGDGGMRELREICEIDEVGKHTRGKCCELVVVEIKNKWRWK